MSKSKRIEKRTERIEKRFRRKIAKGKKGTDMDIELHERRIKNLKDKSPLNFGFMSNPAFSAVSGGINSGLNSSQMTNMLNPFSGILGGNVLQPSPFAGPQIGTQAQIAASAAANQDPNNAYASGFSTESAVGPVAGLATGNQYGEMAPGMAQDIAPIPTENNFSPQAQTVAGGVFGNNLERKLYTKPKALINL